MATNRKPNAVKVVLIVLTAALAGGGFLLAKNGHAFFYAHGVSQTAGNTDVVQGISPIVQDALVLVAAGQSQADQQASFGLLRLLASASHMARPSGAALVWRRAPALVQAMEKEESLLLERVRTVDLQTSRSELCRQAALRFIARTQGAVREFDIELAQSRPAWGTIIQFNTARKELARSYLIELGPCISAAPKRDRAQLADSMLRF